MRYLDTSLLTRIDGKKDQLTKARPLSPTILKKLRSQLQIEMTYNSNAIEGNSLTERETYFVISEGITVKGKPLKDHLEAKDHFEALSYLFELVDHDKQLTLSAHLIRTLHQLVVLKSESDIAGRYRTGTVMITGSSHIPPDPSQVPALMDELIKDIIQNEKKFHPVELAAYIHHRLVFIHPFSDGNGRTARLVMNVLLMREGYPLTIILKNDRRRYYRLLEQADTGTMEAYVRFIAQAVERSLDIYLRALSQTSEEPEKLYTLSELSKYTPYSAKYLNLQVRAGKLEAVKKGRIWLASQEAVQRYIKNRKRKRKL